MNKTQTTESRATRKGAQPLALGAREKHCLIRAGAICVLIACSVVIRVSTPQKSTSILQNININQKLTTRLVVAS